MGFAENYKLDENDCRIMGKIRIFTMFLAFTVIMIAFNSVHASQGEEEEEPEENRIAIMETDYGVIRFELYENWTPITSENFIGLAESGHYDGVVFHRIVDDFVIQTGDGGGSSTIPLEIHENATHVDGAVGMARSDDPDSAEDQFYICDGEQHGLDGDYAVFGIVIEGMEVVREIAQVPVYGENNPRPGAIVPPLWRNVGSPKENVYVQKITIENSSANETVDHGSSTGPSTSGFPIWIVLIVALPVLALVYFFRKGKR
jgi:cyclophilin family peptidyl-prolyl cis-trans isomerase